MPEQVTNTTAPVAGATPPADQLGTVVDKQSQPGVAAGLEKFKGIDGSVDATKVSGAYLEAEKAMRASQQEAAELRKTLAALAEQKTQQNNQQQVTQVVQPSKDELLREFIADPDGFIDKAIEKKGAPLVYEVSQKTLRQIHPELNDPGFAREVGNWVAGLPDSIRTAEQTLEGSDYLVKMFKREKELTTQSRSTIPGAPATESPSAARSSGGRTFTREQIRGLLATNPKEYARLEGEISKAYQEGRVV